MKYLHPSITSKSCNLYWFLSVHAHRHSCKLTTSLGNVKNMRFSSIPVLFTGGSLFPYLEVPSVLCQQQNNSKAMYVFVDATFTTQHHQTAKFFLPCARWHFLPASPTIMLALTSSSHCFCLLSELVVHNIKLPALCRVFLLFVF